MHPDDGTVQSVSQIDPSAHNIPQEEASAVNEESATVDSTVNSNVGTVDLPIPQKNLLALLNPALQAENQQANVEHPTIDQRPISQFTTGYFSKAFPVIFPYVKGDYTEPRLRANLTLQTTLAI